MEKNRDSGPPNLYPFQRPKAEFWLSGSFDERGRAELREADWSLQLEFTAAEFAVLAALILAAHDDAQEEGWGPKGFLKANELQHRIARQAPGVTELDQLPKYIWRIRQKLRAGITRVAPVSVNPHQWSMAFLETDIGYRISVPPGRLHLDIPTT